MPTTIPNRAVPVFAALVATAFGATALVATAFVAAVGCPLRATGAPAATRAAAVDILNVVTPPPPVPLVSTNWELSAASTGIMALCRALTPPATSDGAWPLTRRPMRSAEI
jgi:hypothetical protein